MEFFINKLDDIEIYNNSKNEYKKLYVENFKLNNICFKNNTNHVVFYYFNLCKKLINIDFNNDEDTIIQCLHINKCKNLVSINVPYVNHMIFENINLKLILFSNVDFYKISCIGLKNEFLIINNCIKVSNLTIQGCNKLKAIYINNNIKEITILNCPNLVTIYCNNDNIITSFILTNNKKIKNIYTFNNSNSSSSSDSSSSSEQYIHTLKKRKITIGNNIIYSVYYEILDYMILNYNILYNYNECVKKTVNFDNLIFLNITDCNKLNFIKFNNKIIENILLNKCNNINILSNLDNNINTLVNINCNQINIIECNDILDLTIYGNCNNIIITNNKIIEQLDIKLQNVVDDISISYCSDLLYLDIDINICKKLTLNILDNLFLLNIHDMFCYELKVISCINLKYLKSVNLLKYKFIDQTIKTNIDNYIELILVENKKIIIDNCPNLYDIENFIRIYNYVYLCNTPYVLYNKLTLLEHNNNVNINNNICVVCLENVTKKDFIKTNCKHYYHLECLYKWFIHNNNCPICRSSINENNNYLCQYCFIHNNDNSIVDSFGFYSHEECIDFIVI